MTWIKPNGNKPSNRDFKDVFDQHRGSASNVRKADKRAAKGSGRVHNRTGAGEKPPKDGQETKTCK